MASPSSRQSEVRPVPAPSNPVLLEAQSQWLFTDEELTRTPSLLDGMSMEIEHTNRSKGVNFIVQVGIMLKLPQLTLATASVYMHRFFMRYSMVDLPQRAGIHPYPIAATSLFLATKMEENCRKMKEFVVACCRVAQKKPDLLVDEQSKEFWKWRDTILHNEDLLLEALCFDLQLEQPYRILYDFICYFGVNEHKPLRNAAWAFVNDSSYTVLCLLFTPRVIAASALYAAAKICNVAFEDDNAGRPWWEQLDVNLPEVRRACNRMAQLYEKNSVHRQSHPYPTVSTECEAGADTTRLVRPRRQSVSGTSSDGEKNGRKRSMEAEDVTGDQPLVSHPEQQPLKNGSSFDSSINQEPSPKRQKVADTDMTKELRSTGAVDNINHSQASAPTVPSSSQQTLNGHHHETGNSHDHSQHLSPKNSQLPFSKHHNNRREHPLPPPPPPPPLTSSRVGRRDSNGRGPGHSEAPDALQQRIDEIVQQGLSQSSSTSGGSNNDRYRPAWDRDRDRDRDRRDRNRNRDRNRDRDRDRDRDWDRDWDRDRDWNRERRRSSATSGSGGGGGGGGGRRRSTDQPISPTQPRAPPLRPPNDEQHSRTAAVASAGDEEEGEINEKGDGADEGGGSEEGEL